MTEMVISASLALILHYVAIIQLPQGGNISLVMAPILFIALKNGVVDGCVCGLIVGIFFVSIWWIFFYHRYKCCVIIF
ncbi:energy-coupled thiamine transporter ThiT [Apilactobacillus ozensis]|uniref:energy-coupled thiamine transporter ThiT n=1 Tax=Apilactobacillus ozensis TaxID=866801 RepID=UPI002092798B|nr:energy-coupled thiamine transporter ThiT [Apilactobacillus ozensis]